MFLFRSYKVAGEQLSNGIANGSPQPSKVFRYQGNLKWIRPNYEQLNTFDDPRVKLSLLISIMLI